MELLLIRLGEHHPQRPFLERELHWTTAGTRGEGRLQKKFHEFYSEEEFQILWDISLNIGTWSVQMDGLLLTERCAVIIESKNINGRLHFDEKTGEFFRINAAGEKTVMEDPRVQLNKHIRFLKQFFQMKKINLPVSGLIVFTAKDCEFASKPHRASICKTYQMIEYLLKILQAFPLEADNKKLAKIKKMILANQSPYKQAPLCTYYFIDPKDLLPGVYCRHCKCLSMQRDQRSWICSRCGARDSSAHLLAIQEYFTFVELEITNRKLREFCGLASRTVAKRLLIQLDLDSTGALKNRVYHFRE
ncbi:nuclease-related domain-containing protein [uncultured Planococcus sp.]|uniref:nuclease-related domain-containing protein n=1 Tax=uncultured Planococcus sp. TaxID=337815 RepID=UPI0026030B27|nr:nuclease-related domain-containing protein [uncultured Planococcus sp.]